MSYHVYKRSDRLLKNY